MDGGNPAPVHRWFIPLFIGVLTIQAGGAGFRNHPTRLNMLDGFGMIWMVEIKLKSMGIHQHVTGGLYRKSRFRSTRWGIE